MFVVGTILCFTAAWLRATDTDIWHEIQQAEAKFATQGITYKVRWIRSHPEKRHTWLSDWNEDDEMNSMAGSLATLAMQEYVGMGNTELIQASDSTRVWYAYTQEEGGKKMRNNHRQNKTNAQMPYPVSTLRHIPGNISSVTHQRTKSASSN